MRFQLPIAYEKQLSSAPSHLRKRYRESTVQEAMKGPPETKKKIVTGSTHKRRNYTQVDDERRNTYIARRVCGTRARPWPEDCLDSGCFLPVMIDMYKYLLSHLRNLMSACVYIYTRT